MYIGGGVQEVVLALRDGLIAKGHQALIITPQPRSHNGSKGEGIITIGGSRPIYSYATTTHISASIDTDALERTLLREEFDLLNFHEPWTPMLSRQILSRSNAVHVGTFHATLPDRLMARTLERVITPYTKSILKYLDSLTAVSPAAAKYVSSLTNKSIKIVPNGIDLSKYSPPEEYRNTTTKTIFYVGRLEKRKGLKHLLDAFALLHKKNQHFRLVIAGDGPDREKLQDYVDENGIPHVRFLGYIDDAVKHKYLLQSDLFCSPALYGESFGIVLLEAMASGCVVVAGNNPGYESVLKDRGQLSIVNPKDAPEFARRLNLLAHDEGLRAVWREWALREVKKYDYQQVVEDYFEIYQSAYVEKYA